MKTLDKKIDFMLFVTVTNANPNGDPLNGNRPRSDYNGNGEISDVCIKRKIRNRMQDMGHEIFVQSDDRAADDCASLSERFDKFIGSLGNEVAKKAEAVDEKKEAKKGKSSAKSKKEALSQDFVYANACKKWLDVRSFGQLFAFKGSDGGVSIGVRGPVSIHQAVSLSPVEIHSMQITKSVNSETKSDGGRSSDTMGTKHMVRFGVYRIQGSINVQLAEKTGFSMEDAAVIKESLRTLFENDASSARPEGSLEVRRMLWWEHDCKLGQYPTAAVFRSVTAKLKNGIDIPERFEDYEITVNESMTPGLSCVECISQP